jgi:hypothetical protein
MIWSGSCKEHFLPGLGLLGFGVIRILHELVEQPERYLTVTDPETTGVGVFVLAVRDMRQLATGYGQHGQPDTGYIPLSVQVATIGAESQFTGRRWLVV